MIEAIKTNYDGQEFKSRLEANMAHILDLMDHNWKYEPKSFLLDNGVHYQPDFFVPSLNLWVETRGYSNKKGNKQLKGFKNKTFNLDPEEEYQPDFLVVGPETIDFYEDTRRFGGAREPETWVSRCAICKSFFFYDLGGHYQCRNCGAYDGDHHLGKSCSIHYDPENSQIVTSRHGHLGTSHNVEGRFPPLSEWLNDIKTTEG